MDSISSANVQLNQSAHAATVKGKVNALEETIRTLTEELNFYKKEIYTLRSEKDGLDDTLTRKAQDIRKSLTNDVIKAEEEMKKNYLG